MKASFKNQAITLILVAVLLLSMATTAYAKPVSGSIRFEKVNITVPIGESVNVGIVYDGVDDENMDRLYFSELDRGIVDVKFSEVRGGEDINFATITGLKEGKTTVFLYAGRVHGKIQVTVGRGEAEQAAAKSTAKSAISKEEETLIANDKSALGAALASALKSASAKQRDVTITSNDETIPRTTIKALAAREKVAKKNAIIVVASKNANNETVARLYVEPSKLTSLKTDLKTGISFNAERQTALSKTYSNKLWVIKCAQSGSFGANLEIAAKLGVTEKDVSKLSVYNMDAKGRLIKIEEPSCMADKDGFVRFFTKQAGEIVVSIDPLTKR